MSLLEEVQNDIRHTSRMTAQIILSRSKMRWIVDHCLRKIEKDEIKINLERDVQLFHVFHFLINWGNLYVMLLEYPHDLSF